MGEIRFKSTSIEDASVRVLGEGRTFTLQITDPKFDLPSEENCRQIEKEVNTHKFIFIKNLRVLERKQICQAFEAESITPLTYKFICLVRQHRNIDYCVNAINNSQGLEVTQKTPLRFLRTVNKSQSRKRKIFYLKARKVNDYLLEVDICTQRGLYIADFVTGDMRRTTPSLSEIINAKAEILVLDIVNFKSSTDCPIEDETDVDL